MEKYLCIHYAFCRITLLVPGSGLEVPAVVSLNRLLVADTLNLRFERQLWSAASDRFQSEVALRHFSATAASDDKAKFQEFQPSAGKLTLTIAFLQSQWLAEMQ